MLLIIISGYGDMHLIPDHSSLRIASWLDGTALILYDVHYNNDTHDPVQYAPRSVLRKQLEAAKSTGYGALAATGMLYFKPPLIRCLSMDTELEYYQYRTSYDDANKNGEWSVS